MQSVALVAALNNLGMLLQDAFDRFDINHDQRLDEVGVTSECVDTCVCLS